MTFRRWRRRQVVAGRRYRTPAGIIEIDEIAVVEPNAITDADARRSGYSSASAVLAALSGTEDLPISRIAFHAVEGPDPRDELAAGDALSPEDVAGLDRRLARLDAASTHGPWTRAVLDAIAARPATRAADLAASFGRERLAFKTDVRKLKSLGLTISLDVGYRLSPRGAAYLRSTRLDRGIDR